ncbi:helix-turn-helix domain-containing protein [Gaetbulibacter jejuensis]|uniref:HTH cro/C1-type domain-containing protein n=1 Tax=Gaetbulibacter jejuensis TaxID=584607 RepID=A0ABN1JMZ1_9FLAO
MDIELRNDIQKVLGERIKKFRLLKGLRQTEIAKSCGFYKSGYNSIELGLRNVSLINIYKIAFALDVPVSCFFNDDEFYKFLELYNENQK